MTAAPSGNSRARTSLASTFAFLAIFLVAACFRLADLEKRPFHGDEANQAVKAGMLLDDGEYTYDPHEHHGPTLYYLTLPVFWLTGTDHFVNTEMWQYRLVPVVFGLLSLLLLWGLRPALSPGAICWSALFLALSHAFVYYSRYYIQETLLVCFALAAIVAGYRFVRKPGIGWALACGIALGLIHATKETSVVVYAAMGGALVGTVLLDRVPLRSLGEGGRLRPARIAAASLAAAATIIVLFSSFFTHWQGVLDSVLTYVTYADRAEGAGSAGLHDKPWHDYLHLLTYTYRQAGPRWSEGFGLGLGLLGMLCGIVKRRGLVRFLALYALLLTVAYALIPYKTPWNLLVFFQPLLILAGWAADRLLAYSWKWEITATRWAVTIVTLLLLSAGAAHMARQSWLGNFRYPADVRNPYVYAHTSTAINRLAQRLEDLAAVHPQGHDLHINILKPDADYWPLPWYLRRFSTVGYWVELPEVVDADVIISDSRLGEYVQKRVARAYQFEFHGLRPGVNLHAWIEKDLWDRFMETRR